MKIFKLLFLILCLRLVLAPQTIHAAPFPIVDNDGKVTQSHICPSIQFKETKSFAKGLLDIPQPWSYYLAGETNLATGWDDMYKNIFMSVGQDGVAFGDTNWNQIDFIKMSGSNVKKFVEKTKKAIEEANRKNLAGGGTWSTETVSGKKVDVLTYSSDNGEINKFASGGKVYFIQSRERYRSPDGAHTYDFGLIIIKQALGDAEFECGFSAIMQRMNIKKFMNKYYYNYPIIR